MGSDKPGFRTIREPGFANTIALKCCCCQRIVATATDAIIHVSVSCICAECVEHTMVHVVGECPMREVGDEMSS